MSAAPPPRDEVAADYAMLRPSGGFLPLLLLLNPTRNGKKRKGKSKSKIKERELCKGGKPDLLVTCFETQGL